MITEQSIEALKEEIDLVRVAESIIGLELRKTGSNYFAISPYNKGEQTGSFCITPSRNRFKCFSTGASGDAIQLVMDHKHLEYPDAIRLLAKEFNVTLQETAANGEDKQLKEKKATLYDLNKGAAAHWRRSLYNLPQDHWANRELLAIRKLHPDTIIDFGLGYAPNQWEYIAERMVSQGFFEQGKEIGLINAKDEKWYDAYRDRIMFPVHDHQGRIIGFGGRSAPDAGKETPKYINSKASPIYRKEEALYGLYQGQQEIRKQGQAIIVEGYFDVLMMHQAGAINTVATCGTAITHGHANKLKRMCSRVLLMLDSDKAGIKAMLKSVDILVMAGLTVDVCQLPNGHDPDSYVRSMTTSEYGNFNSLISA